MSLYFPAYVHACFTGGQLVLLNVRDDEYISLGAAQTRAVAPHVIGWPAPADIEREQRPLSPTRVGRLLEQLTAKGFVVDTPTGEREAVVEVPTAQSDLVRERPGHRPEVCLADAQRLLVASASAARWLQFRSLESTLQHVRDLKHAHQAHLARGVASPPIEDVRKWVAAFVRLRPLLFGARDNCLFDSLALIEYLEPLHVSPTWVIGVRVSPFVAHCWLQDGEAVFNDLPGHVRRFTPILVI